MTDALPPGWALTTLGDVFEIVGGATPRTDEPSYWGGDIPWVTPDDLARHEGVEVRRGRRSITSAGFASTSTHFLPTGSVLFSSRAPIGYVAVAARPLCTNQGFKSLIPPEGVDARYVYWYLRHATPAIRGMGSGTTFKEMSKKRMAAVPFVLAPRSEQRRIVATIEEHFSRLDAVEAGIAAAEAKCAALPSIAVSQLFSPKWPTSRLDAVARVGSGATPKRSEDRYWSHGAIPWVTSGAVNQSSIRSADEFISERALAETSVKLWPVGTVLMAMYGEGKTRGKAAVLEFESTCNQACAAIDCDRSILDGRFLRTFLNVQYKVNRRLSSGGVQPNLNLGLIKEMEVPVPTLEVQTSVADQAEEVLSGCTQLLDACAAARRRTSALRRTILAEAFAGRLVHQESSDEPASALLDRLTEPENPKPRRSRVVA